MIGKNQVAGLTTTLPCVSGMSSILHRDKKLGAPIYSSPNLGIVITMWTNHPKSVGKP